MENQENTFKESYFIANKKIGWISGGFTITATWTWAIALLVPSQKSYEQGFAQQSVSGNTAFLTQISYHIAVIALPCLFHM